MKAISTILAIPGRALCLAVRHEEKLYEPCRRFSRANLLEWMKEAAVASGATQDRPGKAGG